MNDDSKQSDELIHIEHRIHSLDARFGGLKNLPFINLHIIEMDTSYAWAL